MNFSNLTTEELVSYSKTYIGHGHNTLEWELLTRLIKYKDSCKEHEVQSGINYELYMEQRQVIDEEVENLNKNIKTLQGRLEI